MEIERGSTRSHSMWNALWKRLWTCHKTDYRMNETKEVRTKENSKKMA